MHTLKLEISATLYSIEELDLEARVLLSHAIDARRNAQSPYSSFRVGAAVATEKHFLHYGCNVERCTLSQTTHAEQNALDTMIAKDGGGMKIRAIAIAAGPKATEVVMPWRATTPPITDFRKVLAPCGHCLQCIWENCHDDRSVRLISLMPDGWIAVTTIGDALPFAFGPEALGIDIAKLR